MDRTEIDRFVEQALENRKQALHAISLDPATAQVYATLYLADMVAGVMAQVGVTDDRPITEI